MSDDTTRSVVHAVETTERVETTIPLMEPLETHPDRPRWVIPVAALVGLLLIVGMLIPVLTRPSSAPLPLPTLRSSSPAPSATATPSGGKVSEKTIASITWPEQVGELTRSSEVRTEGPIASRARYQGARTITASLELDMNVKVAGSGLREAVVRGNLLCGRQTSTAVCMGDVADGLLVIHATDTETSPEQLAALGEKLVAAL